MILIKYASDTLCVTCYLSVNYILLSSVFMCWTIMNSIKRRSHVCTLVKECVSQRKAFVEKRHVIDTEFCYPFSSVRRETRVKRWPHSDNIALFQSPLAVICDPDRLFILSQTVLFCDAYPSKFIDVKMCKRTPVFDESKQIISISKIRLYE
jgi:hypothetical protein